MLSFGSFTEDEIKSLQSQPVKDAVEITFGSFDSVTLRSVGIFSTQPTELYSKDFQSLKLDNKQNDHKSVCSVEDASRSGLASTINVEANGNTSKVCSGHHINTECLKQSQGKPTESPSSKSISALPIHSNLKPHVPETATQLSSSSEDVALVNLSGGGDRMDSKVNVNRASNGPGATTRQLVPRGLYNLGNLCFLNATLQALLSCSPFVQLLQELRCRDIPEVTCKLDVISFF